MWAPVLVASLLCAPGAAVHLQQQHRPQLVRHRPRRQPQAQVVLNEEAIEKEEYIELDGGCQTGYRDSTVFREENLGLKRCKYDCSKNCYCQGFTWCPGVLMEDGQPVCQFVRDEGITGAKPFGGKKCHVKKSKYGGILTDTVTKDKRLAGNATDAGNATENGTENGTENATRLQVPPVTPMAFGAIGDGVANDTDAVLQAFEHVASGGKLVFPSSRTFKVWPGAMRVSLRNATVVLKGKLVGPSLGDWNPTREKWPAGSCAFGEAVCRQGSDPEAERTRYAMLELVNSSNVTLVGKGGGMLADGTSFWTVRHKDPAVMGYMMLKVANSTGIHIKGLTLRDSPMYHVNVMHSRHVKIENVSISVSRTGVQGGHGESPNTDGLNIGPNARDVEIKNCTVACGDDNLVIKSGCQRVLATNLVFTAGKGVSIGSLGERHSQGIVRDCAFRDISISDTRSGARIKTWPGGRGFVQNVTFEDFHLNGVKYAVELDQNYCPPSQAPGGCLADPRSLRISDVHFRRFTGTYAEKEAVWDCKQCHDVNREHFTVRPSFWKAVGKIAKAAEISAFGGK